MRMKKERQGLRVLVIIACAAALIPACSSKNHSSGGSTTSASNMTMNADGSRVAFDSNAQNLVLNGTSAGGTREVFVSQPSTGGTFQLTRGTNGVPNGDSSNPSMSANGQFVAFQSTAGNLIPGTTGTTSANSQVFVAGVPSGSMRQVSLTSSGASASGDSLNPSISADGSVVAFESTATDLGSTAMAGSAGPIRNVFVWDATSGTVQLVSVGDAGSAGNADSSNPVVSPDGRFVAFESRAGNLVPGSAGAASGQSQVFVRDLVAGTTMQISNGAQGAASNGDSRNPAISTGGRFVAFESMASNLTSSAMTPGAGTTNIFVWDRQTGQIMLASPGTANASSGANGDSHNPSISADGRFLVFDSSAGDLLASSSGNSGANVFLRDLQTGTTTLVSAPMNGGTTTGSTTGTIGGTTTGSTSPGTFNGGSAIPVISANGSVVGFTSDATNLTAAPTSGSSNVFLANPTTGTITLVSAPAAGATTAGTTGLTTVGTTGSTTIGTTAGTTVGTTVGTTGVTTVGTTGITTGVTTIGTTTIGTTTIGTTTVGTTIGTTGTTAATTAGTTGTSSVGGSTGATSGGASTGITGTSTTASSSIGTTGLTTGMTTGATTVGGSTGATSGGATTGITGTSTTASSSIGTTGGTGAATTGGSTTP